MDRRERIADPEETLRMALDGQQAKIWTAIPGLLQSFDPVRMVAVVQPSITALARNEAGEFYEIALPLLLDCPVIFPQGGGVLLTFPLAAGDEVLVVFASRCIDAWWQQGGVQGQADLRMHDLSDGFCLPGVRSQPRKVTVSTSTAQLRSDDGSTLIELNPTAKTVHIVAPNGATIDANVTINGNVQVNGTLTASVDVVGGGKSLKSHTHGGVQPGGSSTSPPN